MSTLTIQLADEIERALQARAKSQGKDLGTVAIEVLRAGLIESVPNVDPNDIPYDQWRAAFRAWVASAPKVDVVVDDSRETIYEGR